MHAPSLPSSRKCVFFFFYCGLFSFSLSLSLLSLSLSFPLFFSLSLLPFLFLLFFFEDFWLEFSHFYPFFVSLIVSLLFLSVPPFLSLLPLSSFISHRIYSNFLKVFKRICCAWRMFALFPFLSLFFHFTSCLPPPSPLSLFPSFLSFFLLILTSLQMILLSLSFSSRIYSNIQKEDSPFLPMHSLQKILRTFYYHSPILCWFFPPPLPAQNHKPFYATN